MCTSREITITEVLALTLYIFEPFGYGGSMPVFPRTYSKFRLICSDYDEVSVTPARPPANESADDAAARRLMIVAHCIGPAASAVRSDDGSYEVRYAGSNAQHRAFKALERLCDCGVDATVRRTGDDPSLWTLSAAAA